MYYAYYFLLKFAIHKLHQYFRSNIRIEFKALHMFHCNRLHTGYFMANDLSIALTKTKYINLNTKTQNIFCRLNENLTIFLYTLTGATRKQKEKKVFSFKVYTKVEFYEKKWGFSI